MVFRHKIRQRFLDVMGYDGKKYQVPFYTAIAHRLEALQARSVHTYCQYEVYCASAQA